MNPRPCAMAIFAAFVACVLSPRGLPAGPSDAGVDGVTAVSAKVSDDYVRSVSPDGSFSPETYAFGNGGHYGGSLHDETIDALTFTQVARAIAPFLARQNFVPARDPRATRLLIMLYWGTTGVPQTIDGSVAADSLSAAQASVGESSSAYNATAVNSPSTAFVGFHSLASGSSSNMFGVSNDQLASLSSAMETMNLTNVMRDQTDIRNAMLLGYDAADLVGSERGKYVRGTAFDRDRTDVLSEVEESRYFVVLMAYDFPMLAKQRKHKLLWETRFSISERRNAFDKALPVMAKYASSYFGQATGGLIRTRVLDEKVEIGPMTELGEARPAAK